MIGLYLSSPTEYSLYPYSYIKDNKFDILISGDSLIIQNDNELISYNFDKDFIPNMKVGTDIQTF